MATQTSSVKFEGKKPANTKDNLGFVVVVLLIGAIGALVTSAFWLIWGAITGSIPTFLGLSRLWLDSVAGAAFAVIIVFYSVVASERRDQLSRDGEYRVSLAEFWDEYFGFCIFGIVLIISLIIGIFFSLATGLTITAFAGACYGIWLMIAAGGIYFCKFARSLSGDGEESEEQE